MTTSMDMLAKTTTTNVDQGPVTLAGSAHYDMVASEPDTLWDMALIREAAGLTGEAVDDISTAADTADQTYEEDLHRGAQIHTELGNLALDPTATPEDIRAKQAQAGSTLERLQLGQEEGLRDFRRTNQALAALTLATSQGFTTSQTTQKLAALERAAEAFVRPRTESVKSLKEASLMLRRGLPRLDIEVLRANGRREDGDM